MALLVVFAVAGAVFLWQEPRRGFAGPPPDHEPPPARSSESRLRGAVAVGSACLALFLVPWPGSLPVAALVGALAWRQAARLEPRAVARRRCILAADLPHLVDLMSAAVSAGAAPAPALGRAVALSHPSSQEELAPWLRRIDLGGAPADVWRELSRHPQLGRLGLALLRSEESGAPVIDLLGRLSADLRDQLRADVEGRVRQVEVQSAAPLGGCLLPAFVLLGVVPLIAGTVSGFLLR